MAKKLLIWSYKHGGSWWRASGRGYTRDVAKAGRFDAEEAKAQERRSRGECVAVAPKLAYSIVNAERERVKERAHSEQLGTEHRARREEVAGGEGG